MNRVDDQAAWADVEANYGLVKFSVSRFLQNPLWRERFTFEELLTAASIACFKAARVWNPGKGTKGTFYFVCIRNALLEETAKLQIGTRTPQSGVTFGFLTPGGEMELEDADDEQQHPFDSRTLLRGQRKALRDLAELNRFEDDVAADVDAAGAKVSVREAVLALPVPLRDVVIAHVWDGLTFREIGEREGTSRQRVEQKYQRAKDLLRLMLDDEDAA
jgi:RNA polymerase sigma factor (sigma-70 family)